MLVARNMHGKGMWLSRARTSMEQLLSNLEKSIVATCNSNITGLLEELGGSEEQGTSYMLRLSSQHDDLALAHSRIVAEYDRVQSHVEHIFNTRTVPTMATDMSTAGQQHVRAPSSSSSPARKRRRRPAEHSNPLLELKDALNKVAESSGASWESRIGL